MKKTILGLALMSTVFTSTAAKAGEATCEDWALLSFLMIGTVTSAPTGTTLLTSVAIDCGKEAQLLEKDAELYRATGEQSFLLQQVLNEAHSQRPDLSTDQLIENLISNNSTLVNQ